MLSVSKQRTASGVGCGKRALNELGPAVYSFPRTAVTKYHKLDGLKQHKFIVSQFWRLEV